MSKRAIVRTIAYVQIIQEGPELVDVVASEVAEFVFDEVAVADDSASVEDDDWLSPAPSLISSLSTSTLGPSEAENKGISKNTRKRTLFSILKAYFLVQYCH